MNELNIFLLITNLLITLVCGIIFPLMPSLTRKSYLFGVKIPPDKQAEPEVKALRKNYIRVCAAGAALALLLNVIQYITAPGATLFMTMYCPFLFILIYFAAYIPNWKRAARLKAERGWQMPDTAFADTASSYTRGNLGALPWGWYIAGAIVVIVSFAAALAVYPSLPDNIPVHFDANMLPNRWMPKTVGSVLMMPIINLIMTLTFWPIGIIYEKAKLQIDPLKPALSFAQHRLYRRRVGHCIGFLLLSMTVTFAVIELPTLSPAFREPLWLWFACSAFLPATVLLVIVAVRSGQGGCKIKIKYMEEETSGVISAAPPGAPAGTKSAPPRGDDRFWLLGMFYYNPDDPSNIVEDRFGIGLGFNYARLRVKVVTAILAAAFIAGYAWLTWWMYMLLF